MTNNASADSLAILASRGTFELARLRTITAEDMRYTLKLAMQPLNAREVVVMRQEWDVDGVPVRSPVGEFGSCLTATVELMLVDGGTRLRGERY